MKTTFVNSSLTIAAGNLTNGAATDYTFRSNIYLKGITLNSNGIESNNSAVADYNTGTVFYKLISGTNVPIVNTIPGITFTSSSGLTLMTSQHKNSFLKCNILINSGETLRIRNDVFIKSTSLNTTTITISVILYYKES